MADVITRLKLESSEYDSKIKRATQGLLQMEQECRKAGKSLNDMEKEQLNYVRSLGQMQTVSTSVRGKIGELSNAYIELRTQYNRLTDEEKKGDFGKNLSGSLEQLKGRIGEAKQQLKEVDAELGNTGKESNELSGVLDSLAGRFGLSTKALSAWGLAIGTVTTALKVAKDAFFESETNVDEWGMTVEGAQSIYESFLLSLNSGDFTNFINNIGMVTQAARDAYNAIDDLNTRMTIINPERAKLQARQQELRATIREKGASSEEGKAAQNELKQMQSKLDKSFKKESKMNYNAFEKLVKERLQEGGINLDKRSFDQLMRTFSDDDAYERMRDNAKGEVTIEYKNYTNNGTSTLFGEYQKRTDTRNTEQKLLDLFTDEWRQQNSGYLSASFQALGSAAGNRLRNTRYTKASGGGGGGGKTSAAGAVWAPIAMQDLGGLDVSSLGRSRKDVKSDMAAAQKEYEEAGDVFGRMAALKMIEALKQEQSRMDMAENPMAQVNADFEESMKQYEKEKNKGEKEKSEDDKKTVKMNEALSEIGGGLSGIMGGLEQLGVDLPAGMEKMVSGIQTVSSILSGIATVVTAIQVISSADALIPFARGGVVRAAMGWTVPGHSYADTVPSLLSSGEVVLNRAQQGNLLSQMESGSGRMSDVQPYVDGEKIWLGVTNYLKRKGRGEIVLSKK